VLTFIAAIIVNPRHARQLLESAVIGMLTAAAVFLWRKSANMPALNNDGLHGFSANDWFAPTVTFVILSLYRDLRTTTALCYPRTKATATIIAFAVNVLTI